MARMSKAILVSNLLNLLRRIGHLILSVVTSIKFLGFESRKTDSGEVEYRVRYLSVLGKTETPWVSEDEAKAIYRKIAG